MSKSNKSITLPQNSNLARRVGNAAEAIGYGAVCYGVGGAVLLIGGIWRFGKGAVRAGRDCAEPIIDAARTGLEQLGAAVNIEADAETEETEA